VRFTRDVANITMDLTDVEGIVFRALGGADTVTVNDLTGTDAKTVEVDLAAVGGGGDGAVDTIVVNGTVGADALAASSTTVSGGEAATDAVHVNGGTGNDVITVHGPLSGLASLDADGGADIDTTQVEGTKAADSIQILPNGAAAFVQVAAGTPVNSTAEDLSVLGLSGSDTITGSNGLALITSLFIDGGKSNHILLGGDGADVLIGGPGNDFVDGNRGDDLSLMGEGKDTFHWDPGDGSDTVEGQAGNDTLDFSGANISEQIDVSANGGRVRFTRDVANITMDLDDVEGIVFRALGGADTVTVNDLAGTDAKTVEVDLAASGGGGDASADTVVVNGTTGPDKVKVAPSGAGVKVSGLAVQARITGAEPANDTLRIQTLEGDDTISGDAAVLALIQVVVDLGPDG
jgi:Ca2+-binding RTX toxin-like protein